LGIPATIASFNIVLGYLFIGLKIWALVDAASYPRSAYDFIAHKNKTFWLSFLGLSVILQFASVRLDWPLMDLINLVGLILAVLYLVLMRPKLKDLKK